MVKVLVIGAGGREHALVVALQRSPHVTELLAAPGNPGMAQEGVRCVPIAIDDIEGLIALAREEAVGLVVIGPEKCLCEGMVDQLHRYGITAVGPSQQAAQLEASKSFTKALCQRHGIPTAFGQAFTRDAKAAKHFLMAQSWEGPYVIKEDGLAAGKGVYILASKQEACTTIDMLCSGQGGRAVDTVLIEQFLVGQEVSVFAASDGTDARFLGAVCDHKRLLDEDHGPNTGGMGTHMPVGLSDDVERRIMISIIQPTIDAMAAEGTPFRGILFAGVMMTQDGPFLLEYNVRFGDPETQVLLPSLDADLFELLHATCHDGLDDVAIALHPGAAVCVVMATPGYPDQAPRPIALSGLAQAEASAPGYVKIFHAGTMLDAKTGTLYSQGGRVLGVTGFGGDLQEARERAYTAIQSIDFPGAIYRRDIGLRQLLPFLEP